MTAAVTDWDNELPLLVYHGIKESCEIEHVTLVLDAVTALNKATGKNIYAECLVVKGIFLDQTATSIVRKLTDQTSDYCTMVQNHPVFGKGDFNILAMS